MAMQGMLGIGMSPIPEDISPRPNSALNANTSNGGNKTPGLGRAMGRRERKIAQALEDKDSHALNMTIRIEFALPPQPPLSQCGTARVDPRPSTPGRRMASGSDALTNPATNLSVNPVSTYIHYELDVPQDSRPQKVDIVAHPTTAKVFMESDFKNGTIWTEGEQTWTGWKHTFPMGVNQSLLEAMYANPIEVRIWDTKDHVSSRARFDKPRGGTNPHVEAVPTTAVDTTTGLQPGRNSAIPGTGSRRMAPPPIVLSVDGKHGGSTTVPVSLATAPQILVADILARLDQQKLTTRTNTCSDGHGARFRVVLHPLFVGETSLTAHLENMSTTSLENLLGVRVHVSIDAPLMSPPQIAILNPLSLTIGGAHSLPHQPVPFHELDLRAIPTHAIFQFFGQPPQRCDTNSPKHGATQAFNHRQVILAGLLPPDKFRDWIVGPGLHISIHDRNLAIDRTKTGALFGRTTDDTKMAGMPRWADVNAAIAWPVSSPALGTTESRDPYGTVRADISDLLRGVRHLDFSLPILPSERAEVLTKTITGETLERSIPPGHYVASGAYLNFTIDLAVPYHACPVELTSKVSLPNDDLHPVLLREAFQLLVYSIPASYFGSPEAPSVSEVVDQLLQQISDMNAQILDLDTLAEDQRPLALSTYVLSDEQATNHTLDILTGFVVQQPQAVMLILEGVAAGVALRLYWEGLAKLPGSRSLYNSEVRVAARCYSAFGLVPKRVVMSSCFVEVLQSTSLYVHGSKSSRCLSGLLLLADLERCLSNAHVVKHRLLPAVVDISYIDRDFGITVVPAPPKTFAKNALTQALSSINIPTKLSRASLGQVRGSQTETSLADGFRPCSHYGSLTNNARNSFATIPGSIITADNPLPSHQRRTSHATPSLIFSDNSVQTLRIAKTVLSTESPGVVTRVPEVNFLDRNRSIIRDASVVNQGRPRSPRFFQTEGPVFSYSSQTLNSNHALKRDLQQSLSMQEFPLHSYNPAFHHSASFAVAPISKPRNIPPHLAQTGVTQAIHMRQSTEGIDFAASLRSLGQDYVIPSTAFDIVSPAPRPPNHVTLMQTGPFAEARRFLAYERGGPTVAAKM